jgi:Protein of unknown function (DUF2568)
MKPLKALNLGLAFVIEVCMLLNFAYWGFHKWHSLVLGIGTPLIAVVLWSSFAAPKAKYRLIQPGLTVFKMLLFGLSAIALFRAGQRGWAGIFIVLAAINLTLAHMWNQDSPANHEKP